MNIEQELQTKVSGVEKIIQAYLPAEEGNQKQIMEAMNYSILAGGKRLRPLLMQETFQMFSGTSKVIEPFMAAIEMIHTYSLVHDDLPAMDNDEYRRGRKTTHAVYGEAMGILAGDALLNYAFETAVKAFVIEPDNARTAEALAVLAKKAGIYGMLGGQVVDVAAEKEPGGEITPEKLDYIYRMKTSALMESSMMIGGILAGADDHEVSTVGSAAEKLGIAFQIQDDILDVTSTLEVLGKPIGSDQKNKKVTYVTLFGIEDAAKEVERLSNEAVELIGSLHRPDEFIKNLFLYLVHRTK